ncbi:hypothetical protein [Shimia sp.]
MHTIEDGYRALGLLIDVNWDRFMFPLAIMGGLMFGAYVGVTFSAILGQF